MSFDLPKREIKTKRLSFKLEIELTDSLLTPEEAEQRIQFLLEGSYRNDVSNFIVFLIRETRSVGWELKKCDIVEVNEPKTGKDNL